MNSALKKKANRIIVLNPVTEKYEILLQDHLSKILLQIAEKNRIISCNIQENKNVMIFAQFTGTQHVNLELNFKLFKNSELTLICFVKQCPKVNLYLKLDLIDEHSSADIRNICILNNNDNAYFKVRQNHIANYSKSLVKNSVILDEHSSFVLDGIITVDNKANESSSSHHTKGILLSDQAHVDVSPTLNIGNKNVTCSHGAAVGYFDIFNFYYMQSRGISRKKAESMLIQGEILSALDKLHDPFWTKISDSLQSK